MKPRDFGLVALLLICGACASVDVSSSRDPSADFRQYSTYSFKDPAETSDPAFLSQAEQDRIRAEIRRELETRGYTLSDNPDLMVSLYLRVAEKQFDKRAASTGEGSMGYNIQKTFGFYYGYDRGWAEGDVIGYREGSLIIDLVDTRKERLAWQGIAVGVLYQNRSQEQIDQRIREAVHAVFKRFPTRAGQP